MLHATGGRVSLLNLLQAHSSLIVAAASALTALGIFVKDMLTIQKLRAEIRALNVAANEKRQTVIRATAQETERYSRRYPREGIMNSAIPAWYSFERFGIVPSIIYCSIVTAALASLVDSFLPFPQVAAVVATLCLYVAVAALVVALLDWTIVRPGLNRLECLLEQQLTSCSDESRT